MNTMKWMGSIALAGLMAGCSQTAETKTASGSDKVVVYQVFTRLFGNQKTANKPWGTKAENGVGSFADFTDTALDSIKALGVTHIWYTGVPHHALVGDYTAIGVGNDDPDVVKGRAGSPYAVKDYYNVNPDLATDPAKRLEEFKELVARTHRHGLKVIIDIVPNHVARAYQSLQMPDSVKGFGATDDATVEYSRDNNYYYLPGKPFEVPKPEGGYKPLGGEAHPMADGKFAENPAKWTGNGSRLAQPGFNDWYETVKINYGVRPDGSLDFDTLPAGMDTAGIAAHQAFWAGRQVPSSWKKFRDIALFWTGLGVDGFRFDMAEMVPVEFWSYMNSAIKTANPQAVLIAEIYNPAAYRSYIKKGKMDYLYDKVDLYDSLKAIIQGRGNTDHLVTIADKYADIEHHMLHFLENHDEQRIASPEFAGNPLAALPGMVVSATMSTAPTMIYFGQEVGEPGAQDAGFGKPSRTSIFDYIGVPNHQKWMNGGRFDGGQLGTSEKMLRGYYQRLLQAVLAEKAFSGNFMHLHAYNRSKQASYGTRHFSYLRQAADGNFVTVFTNFSRESPYTGKLSIPAATITALGLKDGSHALKDLLTGTAYTLVVAGGEGSIELKVPALGSVLLSSRKG